MGLAERRALKEFQDNKFPDLEKRLNTAAGFELKLDVNWDQMMKDEYSHLLDEGLLKVFFQPLEEALKAITFDNMGKEALKEGLKQVIIKNTSDYYSPSYFKFEGGTLTIDHTPYSNQGDVKDQTDAIKKILEKGL
jgi:hypothetical protein